MKTGVFVLIAACALGVGFFLGKKEAAPESYVSTSYLYSKDADTTSSEDLAMEHEAKLDELREQLETARDSAEQARNSAKSAAFNANMDWIKSGRVEDMIRMNDAEDVATKAQNSADELEDAINNTDR